MHFAAAILGPLELLIITALLGAWVAFMMLRALASDITEARRRRALAAEVDRLRRDQQQRLRQLARTTRRAA